MTDLLRLCFEFFKTGLFSVGGGLATLPFIYERGSRTGWYTASDVADMVAVSESTPGPLGINMSTYIGFNVGGVLGGILATLSLVLPSVIIIILIAKVYEKFRKNRIVTNIMYGIRPASVALITYAMLLVAKLAFLRPELYAKTGEIPDLFNIKTIILGAAVFFIYMKWKKHPIFFILGAAVVGIIFSF